MNKERLLKLADFLEQLPENKFDFGCIVKGPDMPNATLSCGSVACGIGWTPVLFPDLVRYSPSTDDEGDPAFEVLLVGGSDKMWFDEVAAMLFEMPQEHALKLFSPYEGGGLHQTIPHLRENAKPVELAANIRAYVAAFDRATSNP